MSINIATNYLGFGSYSIPEGQSFSQIQMSAKVHKIFFTIFFATLTVLSIAIIPISIVFGGVAFIGFSALAIRSVLGAVAAFYRGQPMQNLFPNEIEAALPSLGVLSDKLCSGFPTRDGPESHEWKLNLIRAARHTLFLSGCYCGGKAFDEALVLIKERMRLLPELKTSILCSETFLNDENRQQMKAMQNEFGERFASITTQEVFPALSNATDTTTLTTQHTKALVIDYGAAFLVGGSGIVSSWSEQKGEMPPVQKENHGIFLDYFLSIKAYRDMDFVFQSPELNGTGTRLYVEMAKLFERFRPGEPQKPFSGWPVRLEPVAWPPQIQNLKLACYTSGPEQISTQFLDEIVEQVNKAKMSITIGHMYFHPPKRLLEALINASNRGVKITLLTNRLDDQSPGCHFTHAELTRYNAKSLFEGRDKPNVEVYEFRVPSTTYHKKVIVFDGKTTLLGSTNLGEKSLGSIDYEINFKVESEEFAAATAQSLEIDKTFCEKDSSPHISLKTRIFSSIQTLFVPFL